MSILLKNAMEDSFLSYYFRAFEKQNYSNDTDETFLMSFTSTEDIFDNTKTPSVNEDCHKYSNIHKEIKKHTVRRIADYNKATFTFLNEKTNTMLEITSSYMYFIKLALNISYGS